MVQFTYPLRRPLGRGAFTQMMRENFPNLRGNIEYSHDSITVTFLHDITDEEKTRLDALVARLNKNDSDWRTEYLAARQVDITNRQVIYRGTTIVGTVIPYDARGRLLARKIGILLNSD